MKTFERPTIKLNVKTTLPIYSNSSTSNTVTQHWKYNVVEAHAPGNASMKYTIVDNGNIIKKTGVQELSIRKLSAQELEALKKIPSTSSWYNPDIQVYTVQYPIDVKVYFDQCGDWKKMVDLWATEGLVKDNRLVDCFKSLVIPLQGEPTHLQPLNTHAIWLTNSGTGKSFFPYLWGGTPLTRAGAAGALGSYSESRNRTTVHKGWLNGWGSPVLIDEVNTLKEPFIVELLAYLETGKVTRALKIPINIHGTKTVILVSNPPEDDLVNSLSAFISKVCTVDHPERVGRRLGFLLLGVDYKRVTGTPDTSARDEVRRVIETTIHEYGQEIQRMFKDNMDWIKKPEPDIEKEIMGYAKAIPNKLASDFVKGQSYGCIKKLKMSAIRYIILEQLDRVPSGKVDFSDRDTVFQKLLDINRDSWDELAVFKIPDDKEQYVKDLKAKHPTMSLRKIAKLVGVSHTTVKNWLEK